MSLPLQRGKQALALGWAVLLFLTAAPFAFAEPKIHAPTEIEAVARVFLEENARATQHGGRVEVSIGRLDPRLRLTACAEPLQAFQPAGARLSGHTSVGVRCAGPASWSVYLSADIDVFAETLVLTRALARNSALTPDDVKSTESEVSGLGQGYLQQPADIEGMVTRRPLAAGTVLTPAMVKAPQIVKRGDRVRLVSGEGPIQVEMMGEAVNNGARGDRVQVRPLNSKRIVEGWVVSPSVVKVTL